MFYPNLTDEIDKLIQELDAKIKSLHALNIDEQDEGKEWDVRVEVITRIRLLLPGRSHLILIHFPTEHKTSAALTSKKVAGTSKTYV